jgi:hypothetical protein
MRQETVEIQDVEWLRQQAGIDDVELRRQVRRLRVGDVVRLTFLAGGGKFETIRVRITSVRRPRFSGELEAAATSPRLSGLHRGTPVTFTGAHVHSVPAASGRA